MREILVLFVHSIATVVRLARPGGLRAVVAESVLVRHQLLILNRGRKRSQPARLRPNHRRFVYPSDAAGPRSALCHRTEAVYFDASPSRSHQAKVPAAVF